MQHNKRAVITPTIIVILGTTGDLSTKKLIPSLFDLFQNGLLPEAFKIIGVARRQFSNSEYQQFAREALEKKNEGKKQLDPKIVEEFLSCISYTSGTFDDSKNYEQLKNILSKQEQVWGVCANKLFYLAVQPSYYKTIFEKLATLGLTEACSNKTGWTRILVEKPFGNDIQTAQELDVALGKLFKEEQIFRIDHYLAKESLQDILTFRFSNMLFEPLWDSEHIEKVTIDLFESKGIDGRGAFYEDIGALRDVGQNHLLQMLALVAMEDPLEFEAGAIRKERARVLRALKPITKESIIRGQYEGYLETPSVSRDSKTETYFSAKTYINNERWRGVPFYLTSGKALNEDRVEIKVYFKKTSTCLCPTSSKCNHQNILTFRIQPNEGISVLFWAKKPGFALELEPKELSFSYQNSRDDFKIPDAYEKVLFDGISGDQILFASTEEVQAAWHFVTPIFELWKDLPLHLYKKGSKGPDVN